MIKKFPPWQSVALLQDLSADLPRFTAELLEFARFLRLDLSALEMDHIALRCQRQAVAQRWYEGFMQCGTLLSHSQIKGRSVYLFRLAQPVMLAQQAITIVELPWPGDKQYPCEGWEHVELVLPGPASTLAIRAQALLDSVALTAPSVTVKLSQPVSASDRLANPTFAVTNGRLTIKFHPFTIEQVAAGG